ncbi:WD40/YVTN/BNR-like repeat-containing protein [Candidatus Eisenbacteria bacterium]|uniref:WD40/YVTN/BNR-like repeat-containing protein n=1 Tax=Eiseniibacteriota bacterium TaxID=2212470 RepID=A0ABV6YII6_UNCEI
MSRQLLALLCLLLAGCGHDQDGWQVCEFETDAEFKDVYFTDPHHGWIVGGGIFVQGGIIGRTTDGGRSWDFQSGLVPKRQGVLQFHFNAVDFVNPNRGCVVGSGGRILLTDDGGENWRMVRYGARVSEHLYDVHFIDELNGWVTGLGGILRTTDGGETWTMAGPYRSGMGYITGFAIHFLDLEHGWLAGQDGDLRRTSDGGENWTKLDLYASDEKPFLCDLTFTDPENGWVVGENGTILHTTDGGETWEHQSGAEGAFLTSVHFLDSQNGWVVGYFRHESRSILLYTADGGTTWVLEREIDGEELQAVYLTSADHGWAVGNRTLRDKPQRMLSLFAEE